MRSLCTTALLLLLSPSIARAEPTAEGDLVVVAGGRTGRDGIHGATFSSVELSSASESQSGGSVQIGHAIHEKMLSDFVLEASRQRLFHAITDCGAGGLSSAVGEMAAVLGLAEHAVAPDADFFDLGGDSLQATEMLLELEQLVLALQFAEMELGLEIESEFEVLSGR